MALQTHQVDLTNTQKARVRRSMRRVTARATLSLDGDVLIDKWPLLVHVAFETRGVSSGKSSHLAKGSGSVHVVTVSTLDESFVYTVPEWTRKLCTCGRVAAVT